MIRQARLRPSSPDFRGNAVVLFGMVFASAFFSWSCSCPSTDLPGQTDASSLTLERIFRSEEFAAAGWGPVKWSADGSGYLRAEASASQADGRDIVRIDAESGEKKILVPAGKLIPPGERRALPVRDFEFSPEGSKLLLLTGARREFHKTFGDYWILDLQNGGLRKLGGGAPETSLLNPTFSPDGGMAAYVCENNIRVEDLSSHRITRLTSDGSETVLNGTFDYVTEEEFFTTNGFRWSPDSRRIAYWQIDVSRVPEFHMINNTDSLYPRIISFRFSKPGEPNAAARVGIVGAAGGKTLWLQVPGDPGNAYIQNLDWAANSEEVVFQHLNRRQNENEVMFGDARNGRVRGIMKDSDPAWLHVVTDFCWLEHGRRFFWISEKDGWRHAYVVARSGEDIRLVTPGAFDVDSIVHIDETAGLLYYIASPDNPAQRYLYKTALDGRGQAVRLTPPGQPGIHRYQASPDGRWAFQTYSTFEKPPVTKLICLADHSDVRTVVDNSELSAKVGALRKGTSEFFRIDIGGGVLLDAWTMMPPGLEPSKKYPVLFYVYGEPWGSTVQDSWGGNRYLWHLLLTQQGYIVMSVDNRGTRVPRGREWRKVIYGQVGLLASADQAAAVKAVLGRYSSADPERIGIWGASGGGAMTLNAMFRYPSIYRTGIALAAPADHRLYNSIYQERYMGLPSDNAQGYHDGSPIHFAKQLEGHLLLIHGTGDHNVHYQNAEALVNELVKYNKRFTMMAYPNRTHGISEGETTNVHKYELMTRYLREHLPPGPR
ncbi:MAG: S9 family peptidase [Candidatus Aminicenantes bacterium]|nr:S9 family peptidase [Candidatus Aminicenantes bacterium]